MRAALALVLLALAPLAAALPVHAVSGPVTMSALTGFSPPVVVVPAGGSVTWVNTDGVGHTASALLGAAPDSGYLDPGTTYTASFPTAGAAPYRCLIHPWMVGLVVVT